MAAREGLQSVELVSDDGSKACNYLLARVLENNIKSEQKILFPISSSLRISLVGWLQQGLIGCFHLWKRRMVEPWIK